MHCVLHTVVLALHACVACPSAETATKVFLQPAKILPRLLGYVLWFMYVLQQCTLCSTIRPAISLWNACLHLHALRACIYNGSTHCIILEPKYDFMCRPVCKCKTAYHFQYYALSNSTIFLTSVKMPHRCHAQDNIRRCHKISLSQSKEVQSRQ